MCKKVLKPLQLTEEGLAPWAWDGSVFSLPLPASEGVRLFWALSRLVRTIDGAHKAHADVAGALNFPDHRGTATAFPLSGFGISAFFFSLISSLAFPDNTQDLLLLLSIVTLTLPLIGGAFLRVYPESHNYCPVPKRESSTESGLLRLERSKSEESKHSRRFDEQIGTPAEDSQDGMEEETPSLLSSPGPGDDPGNPKENQEQDSPHPDVRGFAMLKHVKFYQLFIILGLFTGIGLMTIKCVDCPPQF